MAVAIALVLRALGLGDLVSGVPALRAVRRALPEHRLVLAAPEPMWPVAELSGVVDGLYPITGLTPLRQGRLDVAVNLHGRGPRSHQILAAVRPRRLIGFRRPELGLDGPEWIAAEHEVRRWCRLVGETLGGDPDPYDLELRPPPGPAPVAGAVVVHPGAAYGARRWPPERYAAVAGALAGDGHHVVVTGSAAERGLAERVRRLAGLPAVSLLAGATSLAELAAVVAGARLVVCGDTGVAHLATGYRTPSVVVFGPVPPAEWGPLAGPHVALWRGSGRGDPWGHDPDPALLAIGVDEVLTAAHGLLRPGHRVVRFPVRSGAPARSTPRRGASGSPVAGQSPGRRAGRPPGRG